MALSIKHPEADKLARELARLTGESLTDAVVGALRERVKRVKSHRDKAKIMARVKALAEDVRRLPVLDPRTPDEILGYDQDGLPS